MPTKRFIINNKGVNIDPDDTIIVKRHNQKDIKLACGDKILYSGARGSYSPGYFLGTSCAGLPICLTGYIGSDMTCISRINASHILVIEWPDYLCNENFHKVMQQYLDDVNGV